MKTNLFNKIGLSIVLMVLSAFLFSKSYSQIRYNSNGKLTIGNTQPYEFYSQTVEGSGMYFTCFTNKFLQLDVSPAAPRIAGTGIKSFFTIRKPAHLTAFNNKMCVIHHIVAILHVYNWT